jgi:peroxiredoxin
MLHRPLALISFFVCAFAASSVSAQIADSPESVHPLTIGSKAPVFVLKSSTGTDVDLAKVFAEKPTILIFFRGGWCPFCNRHLAALAEMELPLRALGFQIIAVSPDSVEGLVPTGERNHLRYRLLSDRDMKATPAYGLAYRIPAANEPNFRANGINLPPIPSEPDFWLPVPAAFIVSRDGLIKFVYSNADPELRVSEEVLLAAAKAAVQ